MVEGYNEETSKFVVAESFTMDLEHSLASLSKWEEIFEKPFLTDKEKTQEEINKYVVLMTLTPNVPPEVYGKLSKENMDAIGKYINAKMTGTTINDHRPSEKNREIVTAEIIYYWMTALNIPFECQYWHLNKLLMLVRVCNLKNAPQKKMTQAEIAAMNRAENARRRKELGTTG
jgi:hypothetical protein